MCVCVCHLHALTVASLRTTTDRPTEPPLSPLSPVLSCIFSNNYTTGKKCRRKRIEVSNDWRGLPRWLFIFARTFALMCVSVVCGVCVCVCTHDSLRCFHTLTQFDTPPGCTITSYLVVGWLKKKPHRDEFS